MGKQRITDKVIRPLNLTSITPAATLSSIGGAGVLPIGSYKGVPAFWDLDKAVNQPLVEAEKCHILGLLDGRLEGYDLKTLTTIVGATSPVGTALVGTLTVPAGAVWFINAVVTTINATGAKNGLIGSWKCSLWPDNATPVSLLGQSIDAGITVATTKTTTTTYEFGPNPVTNAVTVKPALLRLPAGASISLTMVTTTDQVDVAAASTLKVYGYVGKLLVS